MTKRKHSSKPKTDEDDEFDEEVDDEVREEIEEEAKEERICSRGIKVIRAMCLEHYGPTKESNSVVIFVDRSDESYWLTVRHVIQSRRGVKEDYVRAVCHHVRNAPRLKVWSSSSLTLQHNEPAINDITIQQLPVNDVRAHIFYLLASGNAY